MKLLIDECLSQALAKHARQRGYTEASHVIWLGMGGWQDHSLVPVIIGRDWVFVTRNAYDFRGPADDPGMSGEYASIPLHAGLICLNGPSEMDLDIQVELFDAALDEIARDPDLVNQVLEVTFDFEADKIILIRYALPP